MATLLETRTLEQLVNPLAQVGELFKFDTSPAYRFSFMSIEMVFTETHTCQIGNHEELTSCGNPAPNGNVGNGQSVTDDEARGALLKVRVQSAVQTTGLVAVAVNTVLDLLWGVSYIYSSV